jgi:predicted permease
VSALGQVRAWLRAVLRRRTLEREMHEEIEAHLGQATERFRARGMNTGEAMLAARREFGVVGVVQEHARDARGGQWIASILGDLRHAVRHFRRSPLMALTIILTLTLGIGISSAAFGIVSGIFTRPAPGVPDDKSLVTIRGIQVKGGQPSGRSFSFPELIEYSQRPEFTDVAGWWESVVVAGIGGQEVGTAYVRYVTPNFFRTLGLRVGPGRGFGQSRVDDYAEPEFTAVIGHQFALVQFGLADSAVGKTITLNGVSVEIVGVAPPRFLSVFSEGEISTVFLPVSAAPVVERIDGLFTNRTEGMFWTVARLRGDLSIKDVLPAVELVASRADDVLAGLTNADSATYTADVVRLRGDVQFKTARSRAEELQALALIVGLVLLILLVCTTTVSSLLVGSGLTRRHEIAVRLAMGASRPRIVRQLLTESALLTTIAGAAGLAVYALVYRALRDGLVDAEFGPSWTIALATALVAAGTSMLCGLSPALHATRGGVSAVLKDSARTATVKSRLQRTFVVAQIALTQPLLVMLAMMIVTVVRQGDFGNRRLAEHIVRADFDTWSALARNDNRLPAIIERVSALPGVLAVIPQVSGVRFLKLDAPPLPDNPPRRYTVQTQPVAPGYFKGMDQRIVMGREFIESDSTLSVGPIIIGSDFAARVFGAENPIGKRLVTLNWSGKRRLGEAEIVGVVSADDAGTSENGTSIRVFTSMGGPLGVPGNPDGMLIRTVRPAAPLLATFREIAHAEAPMLPIRSMKTLRQMDSEKRSEILEATGASAVGGLITLLLASIGLYAVVALAVNQRQREIGVRVSLGARPGQVVQMFFRSGLRVSLIGLAIGLPLSVVALKALRSQVNLGIPDVNMPMIAAAVALAVIVVASLASWIPARRAAGADPLVVLREG